MSSWEIDNADVVEWATAYSGEPFHAIMCDPPYHLTDAEKGERGFMGKDWDGGDVAFRPETWSALAACLHPGGFLIAFAGARGWHRQACAAEDAGLIMHPTLFGWAFGSGFPKATRVKGAQAFAGHRYGLQAVKPAVEPIMIFQKPYSGRPVDCITRTGAGAFNIDAARIPTASDADRAEAERKNRHADFGSVARANDAVFNGFTKPRAEQGNHSLENGRWPSNLLLLDEGAAAALDEQSGMLTSGARSETSQKFTSAVYGQSRKGGTARPSTGGASRFYLRIAEQIDEADPIYYCAKASRAERDAGLEAMPERRRVYNGKSAESAGCAPGSVEDKFTTQPSRNHHPTVKAIRLTKYLASLLLPPGDYAPRRLLVPFSGVGSEMIGGILAGWDFVQGVERDQVEDYIEIAQARLRYWSTVPTIALDRKQRKSKPKPKAPRPAKDQPTLFGEIGEAA